MSKKTKIFIGNLIIFILLICLCNSCTQNKGESDFNIIQLQIKEKPISITGTSIKIDQLILPSNMIIKDSTLLILDDESDNYIHAVNTRNFKHISSIGNVGKGPGEVLSGVSLDFFDNQIWLHDITLAKFVSFNFDSILNNLNGTYKYSKEIIFKDKARQNFQPVWLNDSTIVSTTFSESLDRLMFTNSKGYLEMENFRMLDPKRDETPRSVHNASYQSVLKVHPSKKKVAIVNRYSDLLEIHNLQSGESLFVKTHSDFTPIYDIVKTDDGITMSQDDSTRFGYIDISVTKDRIFTLYSGRKRGEGRANFAKNIVIYDWEGRHINSYKIENVAIGLVAQNNNILFTSEYNLQGEGILKRYNLNEK